LRCASRHGSEYELAYGWASVCVSRCGSGFELGFELGFEAWRVAYNLGPLCLNPIGVNKCTP
jgi:hypothetical protein